jgi:hypothetical protein
MTPFISSLAAPAPTRRRTRLLAVGGLGLLLSELLVFLGSNWDIQWHQDVGPDTFFTAPHVLIYAGAAFAGLTCLTVVLVCTWRVRQQKAARDPALIPILGGAFWAPVGFVLGGTGAALWLVFGLYDQWWHRVYGFDATLDSPPHTGLTLADLTTLFGCVAVFVLLVARSEQRSNRPTWQAVGLATSASMLLTYTAWYQVLRLPTTVAGLIDGGLVFIALLCALGLMMVVSVVRRPGAATLTGFVYTLLVAGTWIFSSWATRAYADAVGLFPRDDALGYPGILAVLPRFVLPAGVLIDVTLALARRWGYGVRGGVLLSAGVGTLVLVGFELLVPGFFRPGPLPAVLATVIASGAVGAVSGWVGWQLGVVLQRVTRAAR